jgi:cellulose synthase operon protein YhjU
LRANCGQERHKDLYQDGPKQCYTLDALRRLGYQTYAAIDNDAPSYHFVEDIMTYGHADRPVKMTDLPLRQYSFDRSPIYDDLAILNRLWDMRQSSYAKKAAFYVDLTTMHAGGHWAGDKEWWKRNPSDLYREFGERLFSNIDTFFKTLEASGRNVVVIFVPEHGRALRGSSIQAPDVREIPLPAITTVPVGIKFIGKAVSLLPVRQIAVSKPTSYTALAYLLKNFLAAPRFDREAMLAPDIIANIPETAFVAENEANMVVKKGDDIFYFGKDKKWTMLPESALK